MKYLFVVSGLLTLGFNHSFQLPAFLKVPSFNINTEEKNVLGVGSLATKKEELFSKISNTANGANASETTQKEVMALVEDLEKAYPPPSDLLLNKETAKKLLEGTWYLQYTSPGFGENISNWQPEFADEGITSLPTPESSAFKAKGTVRAGRITVDTSKKPTQQVFDIENTTVQNVVESDDNIVSVGGTFRVSPNVSNRAIVAFKYGAFESKSISFLKINFDIIFQLAAKFRGSDDSGWLETTYVDGEELRIGRGNKGTLFILTRDPDVVKP